MDNQRIARELVAVARELTAKGTGIRAIDSEMRSLQRPMKAISQIQKDLTLAVVRASVAGEKGRLSEMGVGLSDAKHLLSVLIEEATRARNFADRAGVAVFVEETSD